MPNLSTNYTSILFNFWNSDPIIVPSDYINGFGLQKVSADWRSICGSAYSVDLTCEGCWIVLKPAAYEKPNIDIEPQYKAKLERKMDELLERLQNRDLWLIAVQDVDGTKHRVRLPVSEQPPESFGYLVNQMQVTHVADNGWAYIVVGPREFTDHWEGILRWIDSASPDGQFTIMD